MVWLVWGGPAAVVVASIVTVFIAVRGGDQPLDTRAPTASQTAAEEPRAVDAMTPAVQARNHAVSGDTRAENP